MILDAAGYHKYLAIKHFIAKALRAADNVKGDVVVKDTDTFREKVLHLYNRCNAAKLVIQVPRRAMKSYIALRAQTYYIKIEEIVSKHFGPTDEYIPAIIAICLLDRYKVAGFTDFNDIDFTALLLEYESFDKENKEHRKLISKHIRCAIDIAEQLTKYKFKGK